MENNFTKFIKDIFRSGHTLHQLIFINVVVFVVIRLLMVIFGLFNADHVAEFVYHYFGLAPHWLAVLTKPWTLITHLFVHIDPFHLLGNMLVLYFSGMIFNEYLGRRKMLATYILGGLSGALLFVTFYNIFPRFLPVLSASVAV